MLSEVLPGTSVPEGPTVFYSKKVVREYQTVHGVDNLLVRTRQPWMVNVHCGWGS